jgi:hypothetical protein
VRRGNCDPVTIMELPKAGPVLDPLGLCRISDDRTVTFFDGPDAAGAKVRTDGSFELLRSSRRWCTEMRAALAVAIVLTTFSADASATCKSTCIDELRSCRRGCTELRGGERRQCAQHCSDQSTCAAPGAVFRTIAYVTVACQQDARGFSASEKLVVRRGNCDPVTVMELPSVGPVADAIGLCRLYGDFRVGQGSVLVGRFQRLGVLPDGSAVVFEITNDYSPFPMFSLEPPEEGLFFVRPDRTGEVRRLGPATGLPIATLAPDPLSALGFTIVTDQSPNLSGGPGSGRFAFVGLGPGPTGNDAPQVFLLDPFSGSRTQLTHLPAAPAGAPATGRPYFADERTIAFFNGPAGGGIWRVKTDGSDLAPVPGITVAPGATVVPNFGTAAGRGNAYFVKLPGQPVRKQYDPSDVLQEIFLFNGPRALQLTALGYPDTGAHFSLGAGHVIFSSSADPFGENRAGVCQLFSVSAFGAGLRQLTHFPDDGREKRGCARIEPRVSCATNFLMQHPVTGAPAFPSSCDPLGRNPNGEQLFTMRLDGTGLRQITSFRGIEDLPDGGVHVEMAGPAAFSAVVK